MPRFSSNYQPRWNTIAFREERQRPPWQWTMRSTYRASRYVGAHLTPACTHSTPALDEDGKCPCCNGVRYSKRVIPCP
jgi:hypothetical protein